MVSDSIESLQIVEDGKTLTLRSYSGDYISGEIKRSSRFYEQPFLALLRKIVPPAGVIADIGAHVGNHSLYFSEFLSPSRLLAFEPEFENFNLLRENIGERGEPYRLALSGRVGRVTAKTHPANRGVAVLEERADGDVEVITLDSLELSELSLMKIDVGDGYLEVLKGAIETIKQCRPVIGIHGRFNEIFPILAPLNYIDLRYFPEFHTLTFIPAERLLPSK